MNRCLGKNLKIIQIYSCSRISSVIPRSFQVIPRSFPGHSQVIPRSFPGHSQVIPRSFPGHSQVIPRSFPGHSQVRMYSNRVAFLPLRGCGRTGPKSQIGVMLNLLQLALTPKVCLSLKRKQRNKGIRETCK